MYNKIRRELLNTLLNLRSQEKLVTLANTYRHRPLQPIILICGLKDHKTQKELLCIQNLTLAMAIEKARAAEAIDREIIHFTAVEADALKLYNPQKACPRYQCGQHGYAGATCRHKKTRYHVCKKLGHLSLVHWHNQQQELTKEQSWKHKKQSRSTHTMHALLAAAVKRRRSSTLISYTYTRHQGVIRTRYKLC